MSGKFRIGGAILFGTVLIAGAFMVSGNKKELAQNQVVAVAAPPREYIPSHDSNADGVRDWEEELLRAQLKGDIPLQATGSSIYTPPDTLTGQFAETFFKDFIQGKAVGQLDTNKEQFLQNAVATIQHNTTLDPYSRSDVRVVEGTPEVLQEYGNTVAAIILNNSVDTENELDILARATKNQDEALLQELDPIIGAYKNMLEDTLATAAPSQMVGKHIDLVNALQAVHADIAAMQKTFSDPLYALMRTDAYLDDTATLYYALAGIMAELRSHGIQYETDESGYWLEDFTL